MPRIGTLKRALVTGASGFIGRVLCARLKGDGIGVRAVMRRSVSGPWGDVWAMDLGRDPVPPSLLEGVDTVFHLAGKAHAVSDLPGDDEDHYRITVEGTRRLLETASASKVERFIFFSSVKAMGEGGEACLDESAACEPETPYGRVKLEAERLVTEFGERNDAHVVNVRLSLVYGPGSMGNLTRMLDAVAAGRFPPLPESGNQRSLVHVGDVVEAVMLACQKPQSSGQTYILTDGRSYSTRELYDMMRAALGKRALSWSVPSVALRMLGRLGDHVGAVCGKRFVFDSDAWQKLSESAWYSSAKAQRELGYRPARTLPDALPEMVAELRRTG